MTPKYYLGKRSKDETGISGTGTVFVAVDFGSDIGVVTAWRSFGDFKGGTYCYGSIEQVIAAHGHNGSTELIEFNPNHPSAHNIIQVNNDEIYFVINDSACNLIDTVQGFKCIGIVLNVSEKKNEKEKEENSKPKLYLVK